MLDASKRLRRRVNGSPYNSFADGTNIFNSPEPKAPGELTGWEASAVRPPLNDFSSENTGPNVTKFHIQSPGTKGTKNS